MPIYEYQCAACGTITEAWQKFSDAPLSTCPACGGALSRLISTCTFHLKGSGWYVSDYGSRRSASAAGEAGKEAAGKDAGGDKSPGRSESSPK